MIGCLVAIALLAWVIARAERRRSRRINRSIWLTDFWSRDCRPSGSMYTVGRDVKRQISRRLKFAIKMESNQGENRARTHQENF